MRMLNRIILHALLFSQITADLQYEIGTTWNGEKVLHDPVKINFSSDGGAFLRIDIQAPYFGAPSPPDGTCKQGYPFDQLYNYEVVETFFLCDSNVEYVELEFAPCGAHLLLLLHPTRVDLVQYLPVNFTSSIDYAGQVWRGTEMVPVQYLPNNVNRFNAFAIHRGTIEEQNGGLVWEDGQVYESLYPVTTSTTLTDLPDFHNLDVFGDFDPSVLGLVQEDSQLWDSIKQSKLYYKMETTVAGSKADKPVEVWFESLDELQSLKITVRQESERDIMLGDACDSLYDYRHDNTAGVQVYFVTEDDMYLQVLMGYTGSNSTQIDVSSECVSASFLWGPNSLLERRFGSSDNFYYSESFLWKNGRQVWEGTLVLSWDFLPPKVKNIQIINNNNDLSPQVDLEDIILFREGSADPLHNIQQAGLVYRPLLVDEMYNDEVSPIWAEITHK